jgi:hypothetical protein
VTQPHPRDDDGRTWGGNRLFTRVELAEFLAVIAASSARDLSRHQRRLESAKELRVLDADAAKQVAAALDERRRVLGL